MRRAPIDAETIQQIKAFCDENPELTAHQLGKRVREMWPDSFNPKTTDKSCWAKVVREAAEHGIEIYRDNHKQKYRLPPSHKEWQVQCPELVLPFRNKVLIISDSHFPMHEQRVLGYALKLVESWQPDYVVWNGDFLDNAYKGHRGKRDATAPTFTEGLFAHAEVVSTISELAPDCEQVFLKGNHDNKPERDTDMELPFTDWLKALWWNDRHDLVPRDAKLLFTDRYYAHMEPQVPKSWPFEGPDNFPWIFTHQSNYGKNPLSVAGELGSIEMGNMVCGHQHHLSISVHKSGKMYICDAGTFQDPDSPRYKKERHSRHPQWGCGFLTLEYGVPQIWPSAAPRSWWDSRL